MWTDLNSASLEDESNPTIQQKQAPVTKKQYVSQLLLTIDNPWSSGKVKEKSEIGSGAWRMSHECCVKYSSAICKNSHFEDFSFLLSMKFNMTFRQES